MKVITEKLLQEKVNPKNAEINAKIFSTLKTKRSKEPKYRADLESIGLTLMDENYSFYDYWNIQGTNGNTLCISTGLDKVPRLYDMYKHLVTKEAFDKFDYLNYLTSLDATKGNEKYNEKGYTEDTIGKDVADFQLAKSRAKDFSKGGVYEQSVNREIEDISEKIKELQAKLSKAETRRGMYDQTAAQELQKAADILNNVRSRKSK